MIKRILVLAILIGVFATGFSQAYRTCFATEATEKLRTQNPNYNIQMERTINMLRKFVATGQQDPNYASRAVRTIPVIFHVLYNSNTPAQNVSDAIIQQTFAQLNRDYSKTNTELNSARSVVQPIAVNTEIQFCLAQRDPNGATLATPGITRKATTKSCWDRNTEADDMKYNSTGGDNAWNPLNYLNIWIVSICGTNPQTGGVAGYSYIASVGNGLHGQSYDGIVIDYSIGLGNGNSTLTHEVGHYLGLYHTWGTQATNACGTTVPTLDDGFSDTPDSRQPHTNCTASASCTGNSAYGDLHEDFMDYSSCPALFTTQQANYMNNILTNERTSLINSTVCSSTGAPVANFTGTPTTVCSGQSVTFTNTSTGTGNTYSWTFAGGTPGTSTATNPTVTYNTPGTYTVTLVATNTNGNNTKTQTNYITVSGTNALPLAEGFDGTTFPPTGWAVNNPDAATTWARTTSASGFGTSTACAYVYNFNYNAPGQKDWLITPSYNFTGVTSGRIKWDYAYRPYNQAGYEDSLEVLYSTNCGATWISLWRRGGAQLGTATATDSNFVARANQWRQDSVSLAALSGQSNVRFAFKNACEYGNNIFLDNVNIYNANAQGGLAPVADFVGTPTTVVVGNTVAFTDLSTNSPTSRSWSFTGGTPNSSTAQNPTITYNTVGTYNVSLTATNGNGSNTATKTNYITVIAAGGGQTCDTLQNTTALDTLALYTLGANGYLSGNNSYGDLAKAEFYTNTQSINVNGAFFLFGRGVVNGAGSITANVWDASGAGGTPGAVPVATSAAVNISTIIQAVNNNFQYIYIPFTTPPTITGNFYVGFTLPTGTGDSVAIFTTSVNSPSVGQGWEQWSDGTWHNYNDAWDQVIPGFEVSNIIYPAICTTTGGGGPVASFTANNTSVCAGSTVSFTSTSTGSPTSYSWSFTGGSPTASSLQNPSVVYNTPGTYAVSLTASNANGSNTSPQGTITVYAKPTVTSSSVSVLCYGGSTGSATVIPSGGTPGYTYNWSGGGTLATISNKIANTYTVTVTDSRSCSVTTSVNIGQPLAALTAVASANNAACNQANGSASVIASGGSGNNTYIWSNQATTANVPNLVPGTYSVTVTDGNGCSATASATVGNAVNNFAVSISSQNATCGLNNGSASAIPNDPNGVTYQWNNTSTNGSIASLDAGTYSVTVTNPAGCTASSVAIISSTPNNLSVSFTTTQTACGQSNGGATVNATGGVTPYTYNWGTGSTTSSITNVAAGAYPVTVTDNAGCTILGNASVSNTGGPSITITPTSPTCFGGQNGGATASVSGGNGPFNYNWSSGGSSNSITGVGAGTYVVSVTDNSQCVAVQSVTVTNPAAINVSVVTTGALCGQQNGTALVSATGGTGSYTYNWNNSTTTANNSNLAGGSVSVTVTDGNSCTATAAGQVGSTLGPTSTLNAINGTCQIAPQINASVAGGTLPYTYLWSNGATTQNIQGIAAGSYTITITDANGCRSITSATVTDNSTVNVTFNSQNPSVANNDGSITASPSGGQSPYSFSWSTGATTAQVTNLAAGTYSVTITDANSCVKTASVTLTAPATGISNVADITSIKLYPNPAKDVCNLQIELARAQAIDIRMYNSIGQQVYSKHETNFKNGIVVMDISELAAAVYTIRIQASGSNETLRFVKE